MRYINLRFTYLLTYLPLVGMNFYLRQGGYVFVVVCLLFVRLPPLSGVLTLGLG